jgi:hypothetical protein
MGKGARSLALQDSCSFCGERGRAGSAIPYHQSEPRTSPPWGVQA